MGPSVSMLYPPEDPWRGSAFISILAQLLLTVLVLVHTILSCVTFQLVKWYGWWISSCRSNTYSHSERDSCVAKKPLSVDSDDNKDHSLISTGRFLKRSRGEDWQFTSRPLVCPNCHGAWTFQQGFSCNSDRAPISKWDESPTSSDAGNLSGARSSYSEEGARSKYGCEESMTPRAVDEHHETSNFSEKDLKKTFRAKKGGDADKNVWVETGVYTEEFMTSANMPKNVNQWSQTPATEDGLFSGGQLVEQAGSVSTGYTQREIEDKVLDKDTSVIVKRRALNTGGERENAINSFKAEKHSVILGKDADGKEYDSESLITALRHAVQKEREKLCAVHAELEVERISSETAANEAMSMISRLQEEKAALCMQAVQYQRLAEEKANYDQQAMQLLKEILYRKERENYLLEREVKFMKKRIFKDVRKFGKKRQDAERRPFSEGGESFLLLKNTEGLSDHGEDQGKRDGLQELETRNKMRVLESVGQSPPYLSRNTEEQPWKRLKALKGGEDGTSQGTFPASDTGRCALVKCNAAEQRDVSPLNNESDKESGAPSTSCDRELATNLEHPASKVSESCKYGEGSREVADVTHPRKGTTGYSMPSSSVDVAGSSSETVCAAEGQETLDRVQTNKLLQSAGIDSHENTKTDRQYSKNGTVPRSCPSSLNKGSGMNKNESSLISHVH